MEYVLDATNDGHPQNIMVGGVGGTGGFLAESLCRLLTGRNDNILLVDHDRIEPHNLLRQNFVKDEVGKLKSQALAERLAREFKRPIEYVTKPFRARFSTSFRFPYSNGYGSPPNIIIGCADNAPARREIAQIVQGRYRYGGPWLIDAGNGNNWGQILIGNTTDRQRLQNSFEDNICLAMPAPTMQRPDILTYVPDTPPDLDCAAAMDLADQDPTINQAIASLTIQVVRRMLAGTCPFMSLYADLDAGVVTPTYATPENVSRITGITAEDIPKPYTSRG